MWVLDFIHSAMTLVCGVTSCLPLENNYFSEILMLTCVSNIWLHSALLKRNTLKNELFFKGNVLFQNQNKTKEYKCVESNEEKMESLSPE